MNSKKTTGIKKQTNGRYTARFQAPTAEVSENGDRRYKNKTKTFDTKGAAEAWLKSQRLAHRDVGRQGTFSLAQLAEYSEAKQIAGDTDLREIVREWRKRNPESKSVSVSDVRDAYFDSVEYGDLAEDTQGQRKYALRTFCELFGERQIASIEMEEVEELLDDYENALTRNSMLQHIKALFKWAMGRKHRFLSVNVIAQIEPLKVDFQTPEFLSVEQVEKLFETAIAHDPAFIPFLAFGHFAGIRPIELRRMEKGDVHMLDRRINIRPEVAKRKRKGKYLPRLLDGLPEVVWAWLEAVDFDGTIDTVNYADRRRHLYKLAGITEIPNSAARHSFATYAYGMLQDAGRVRKWTGHRTNDTIFLSHYAGLVDSATGKAYFDILPERKIVVPNRKKPNSTADYSDEDLIRMKAELKTNSAMARRIGVSDNAIKKRFIKMKSAA